MLSMQVRDPIAPDCAAALRQRMLQARALGRADLAAQVTHHTTAQHNRRFHVLHRAARDQIVGCGSYLRGVARCCQHHVCRRHCCCTTPPPSGSCARHRVRCMAPWQKRRCLRRCSLRCTSQVRHSSAERAGVIGTWRDYGTSERHHHEAEGEAAGKRVVVFNPKMKVPNAMHSDDEQGLGTFASGQRACMAGPAWAC